MSEFVKVVEIGGNETVLLPDGSTRRVATWYGRSDQAKPKKADGARDPDRLYEKDTGNRFVFDEENDTWYPV